MKSSQLINQDSGDFEYYTPAEIVESARRVMGRIQIDPASSAAANRRVNALQYFDAACDGLAQPWIGNVWMNHPFSRENNSRWIAKLVSEFRKGNTTAFCCITYASTSEKWFQPLMQFPQCFLTPRTNYFLPDGTLKKGVTKGSVVTYGGCDAESFAREFSQFGTVKITFTPKL